ncbi:MAG: hypothetical protein JSW11_01680 [Candidatus Heimdallarchaeota archaeon]|nr:MAG: hypothetical protein JSW11_01680 [Candidatus Heimdallarchaeota archaeon]
MNAHFIMDNGTWVKKDYHKKFATKLLKTESFNKITEKGETNTYDKGKYNIYRK